MLLEMIVKATRQQQSHADAKCREFILCASKLNMCSLRESERAQLVHRTRGFLQLLRYKYFKLSEVVGAVLLSRKVTGLFIKVKK